MTQDEILKNIFKSQSNAIQQVIKRTCIVDFGVVVKVLGVNVIEVGIAVADSVEDVQLITCTLISPCSTAISMNIEPNVGDKVVVLFSRHYNPAMFKVKEGAQEPIIDDTCQGYTRLAGLAILMNQFDADVHNNFIDISKDGNLSLGLAYDGDKDILTLNTDKNGAIHLDSNEGKFKFDVDNADGDISTKVTCNDATAEINKDSEITVTNPKASAKIDKDGAVTITSNTNTKINIDKNGNITLEAGGKVSIKNSSANLFSILDGMLNILNTSLATAGSPASHTVVPSQFQAQQTQLGQLMQ